MEDSSLDCGCYYLLLTLRFYNLPIHYSLRPPPAIPSMVNPLNFGIHWHTYTRQTHKNRHDPNTSRRLFANSAILDFEERRFLNRNFHRNNSKWSLKKRCAHSRHVPTSPKAHCALVKTGLSKNFGRNAQACQRHTYF